MTTRSMNRVVVVLLSGLIGIVSAAWGDSIVTSKEIVGSPHGGAMHVSVRANGNITLFALNDSQAAKALYDQLPLTIKAEPYSDNEVIFYPPKKLATAQTPKADARAGTLAYYAPWGDVVMFYKDFGSASGLYELGKAVSGTTHIADMTGMITIERADSQR